MKHVYNMTDTELAEIERQPFHPQHDEALEEIDLRDECRRDPRVAQGLGRAVGDFPA